MPCKVPSFDWAWAVTPLMFGKKFCTWLLKLENEPLVPVLLELASATEVAFRKTSFL